MQTADTISDIWRILDTVTDPEVPVLTILDLGVVREVSVTPDHQIRIAITPTYSGCPAMDVIRMQIRIALQEAGYRQVEIVQVLSPAWTTDWMSTRGKEKLRAFGIAPPQYRVTGQDHTALFAESPVVPCPHCGATETHRISEFGSTACKSLYQCDICLEPFDYFKCH
jgi:ring-1,2-phenylacetyl-CoA epoxidase subunit PaaD